MNLPLGFVGHGIEIEPARHLHDAGPDALLCVVVARTGTALPVD